MKKKYFRENYSRGFVNQLIKTFWSYYMDICSYRNNFLGTQAGVLIKGQGAQWLSGRVLDLRPKGCGFKPYRLHCIVVLEQDTFILA